MKQEHVASQYPCRCCSFRTLTDPLEGSYELCPVCGWEDDPVQNEDQSFEGGANKVTLVDARRNFIRTGRADLQSSLSLRSPLPNEIPPLPALLGVDRERLAELQQTVALHLLVLARGLSSGELSFVEGCTAIADRVIYVENSDIETALRPVLIAAGQMDELSGFSRRQLWNETALRLKDDEAAQVEASFGRQVRDSSAKAEPILISHLMKTFV